MKAKVISILKNQSNDFDVTVKTEKGTFLADERLLRVITKVGDMVEGKIDANKIFLINKVNHFEEVHGEGSSLKK